MFYRINLNLKSIKFPSPLRRNYLMLNHHKRMNIKMLTNVSREKLKIILSVFTMKLEDHINQVFCKPRKRK